MAVEPLLDHVVLAGPDLAVLVSSFWERTGISPAVGARHEQEGTASFVVGLGGMRYLQLIGPDPISERAQAPTVFGIDRLKASRVAGWMVRPRNLDQTVATARAGGYDPGSPRVMTRRAPGGTVLSWRLARGGPDGMGPVVPGLIDWQASPHPAAGSPPRAGLASLTGHHPDPTAVTRALDALGAHLPVRRADTPGLSLVLDTPNGPVTLC